MEFFFQDLEPIFLPYLCGTYRVEVVLIAYQQSLKPNLHLVVLHTSDKRNKATKVLNRIIRTISSMYYIVCVSSDVYNYSVFIYPVQLNQFLFFILLCGIIA